MRYGVYFTSLFGAIFSPSVVSEMKEVNAELLKWIKQTYLLKANKAKV